MIEGSAVRLDGNVSASVDEVLLVPQGIVLRQLMLFILYNFKLFHILGSYIVGYANDTTIYAVIRTQHSCPQVMKLLNQDLASIDSWCLKWHMRLNPRKAKSIVDNLSKINAPGYGDLTLCGAEFEEVKSAYFWGCVGDYIDV